jgi:hypothetical protein
MAVFFQVFTAIFLAIFRHARFLAATLPVRWVPLCRCARGVDDDRRRLFRFSQEGAAQVATGTERADRDNQGGEPGKAYLSQSQRRNNAETAFRARTDPAPEFEHIQEERSAGHDAKSCHERANQGDKPDSGPIIEQRAYNVN